MTGGLFSRLKYLIAGIISIPFVILLVVWIVGPPIAVVWETVDLLRMTSVTDGQVLEVKHQRGGKGGWYRITYQFSVNGQQFVSDRYLPGFFGKAQGAEDVPINKEIRVHYNATNPALCTLEYGWFKWSVGMTFWWMGLAIAGFAISDMPPGRIANHVGCAGAGCVLYGVATIFFSRAAIRVGELHWHILALSIAYVGAFLAWQQFRHLPQTGGIALADPQSSPGTP